MTDLTKTNEELLIELEQLRLENALLKAKYEKEIADDLLSGEIFQQSPELFKSQIIAGLGSFVIDFSSGKWESSIVFDHIMGIDSTYERTTESWVKLIHPEEQQKISGYFSNEVSLSLDSFDKEFRIIRYNDKLERWIHCKCELKKPLLSHQTNMLGTVQDITVRKRAEILLQENEEIFSQFMEHSPIYVFFKDENGRSLRLSKNYEKMLNKPIAELLDKNMFELFPSEFANRMVQDDIMTLKEGKSINIEEEFSGSFYSTTKFPIFINGKPHQLAGYSIDITKQKKTEKTLIENARLLKTQMIAGLGSYMLHFSRGRWNSSIVLDHIFGIDDTFNRTTETWLNIIHPDDRQMMSDYLTNEVIGKHLRFDKEYRIVRFNDKVERWVQGNGELEINSENEILTMIGTIQDITERKIAEEKLRKLSMSVEQSPVSIFISNISGIIEYVNPKFTEISGYTFEEVIGQNPKIFKSGEQPEEFYKNFWSTILAGNIWEGEFHNKKKNGELYWENAIISPITNEKKEITHFVAIKEDITEKKKMIDDLVIAKELAEQSNKLKDAFIATMSHEIRTPLNGILGMTSIINELFSPHITEKEEKYFASVEVSCNRIARTVDMILDFSRLYAGAFIIEPEMVDISLVCECSLEEFTPVANKKSIELSFQNKVGRVLHFVDKRSVNQSISDLIDNAIKFTESGFVKIEFDKNINDEIIFSISDSGIGISPDYLKQIFEPYSQEQIGYSRGFEGIGLSLAIAKKVLELNHASISVESIKGLGTTFTINFGKAIQTIKSEEKIDFMPDILDSDINVMIDYSDNMTYCKDELYDSRDVMYHISTHPAECNRGKILMVEDDEINQELGKLYTQNDYDIILTDSSDTVLQILRDNKIDVILMDISINGAKNGLELTAEIKAMEIYSHIPIIAVTAHASVEDRENAKVAGCNDFLTKPFTKNKLLEKIEKVLS